MSRISDYLSDSRWYLRKAAVRVSNARYRAGRQILRPVRAVERRFFLDGYGNWRRRRFAETGKGFRLERATRAARLRIPVYRDRINRATGRQRGTEADVAAHDRAVQGLRANARRDRRAGVRSETPAFQRLNARVNAARTRLSPVQRTHIATDLRIERARRRARGRSR